MIRPLPFPVQCLLLAPWFILTTGPWILLAIIRHTPRFIWICIRDPITAFTNIGWVLYNCAWAVQHLPPTLFGIALSWFKKDLPAMVRRAYWKLYQRIRITRTQHRRQRRRALTYTGLRMPAQDNCSFLTKLPAEIRIEIYGMSFGHHKLLVLPVKRGWRLKPISLPAPVKTGKFGDPEYLYGQNIHSGLLDLSLTCKQM